MKFAILIIILIYLLANVYVFHRIWVSMPPNTPMRISLLVVAALLLLSLIFTFTLGESLPVGLTSVLYTVGSSWLFILIYFVLAFLVQDIILLINRIHEFIPKEMFSQFSKGNWVTMLFTFTFITLLMVGGYLHYNHKQRVYLPLEIAKPLSNDTLSTNCLKIVGISDLHLGYTIGNSELEKWVEQINKENPDLILIAGDVIDNSLRPVEQANMAETLKNLKAKKGIYACLGNHEYIGGVATTRGELTFFDRAGIKLLRDDVVELDSCLYIVGRDDKSNKRRQSLSELTKRLDKSKPILLLDHQPFDLHEAAENGIDLQLSGHTHKGQVWPVSIITKLIYEIDHGYLKKENTHIYVSSGIGIWGGKFRIGTQSEYVVFELTGVKP